MKIQHLRAPHIAAIDLQPAQSSLRAQLTNATIERLVEAPGIAIVDESDVLACVGLAPQWPGRCIGWALLSAKVRPNRFIAIHRMVAAALDRFELRHTGRIEIQVDPSHAAAVRWAAMLGFEVEGRLRYYLPDGRDMLSMARIS